MRVAVLSLFLVLVGCASSPSSPGPAAAAGNKAPEALASHDIGGGTAIRIPASWTFNTYYMPPELNASNVRITAHGIRIAITGMLGTGPMLSMSQLTDNLAKGTAPYLALSKERVFDPHGAETTTSRLVYAAFSAADEKKGLPAMPNEHSLMVTSAIISKDNAAFVVTISVNASDSEAFTNYVSSLEALRGVQ